MPTPNPQLERIENAIRGSVQRHWVNACRRGVGCVAIHRQRRRRARRDVGRPQYAWLLVERDHRTAGHAIGAYLLWRPLAGILSLTLVVAALFAAQGVTQIITAIGHRSVLRSWVWLLLSGVIDLILAAIIFSAFPGSAAWVIGLLFGINLMTAPACHAGPVHRTA